jgi:hypothetical protein
VFNPNVVSGEITPQAVSMPHPNHTEPVNYFADFSLIWFVYKMVHNTYTYCQGIQYGGAKPDVRQEFYSYF